MKNITNRIFLFIVSLGLLVLSCSKSEKDFGPPTIELLSGDNIINSDTSAYVASTLNFKVHCKWNGENALTNFIVTNNGAHVIDEGMNIHEFEKSIDFAKSSADHDSIEFIIRDIQGNSAKLALVVDKKTGSGGGELVKYSNISMDAQNSINGKGFLTFSDGTTFSLQDAYNIQGKINLLYYYDLTSTDANTIASPGANIDASIFTGTFGLSNWTTKNTTRFIKLSITQQQFEDISDPVYVVNTYTAVGNRKAKNLVVGDVYSFKDESNGKYGIFRVYEVTGQDAGKVVISIVMQK